MYQVSRAIYREIASDIPGGLEDQERVLRACERTIQRLVADRHYFAHPVRTLFQEVRPFIPMHAQPRVWRVVQGYIACTEEMLARMPRTGLDLNGQPLQCRATTRRGTPCQRLPQHDNGYCPSHQHLAQTEEIEVEAGAALAA